MKRLFLFVLFLLSWGGVSASGHPDAVPVRRADTVAVEPVSAWDKIRVRMPRISGFVQAGYQYSGVSSELFVKRARLSLSGDVVPKFSYKVQFEFCKPRLVDAYLQFRPFRQLGFRAGQFKIPFSLENTEYGLFRFEFIDYPLVLRRLMGFNDVCGLAASGRDIGVSCFGGFFQRGSRSVLRYDFALFNGEGINTHDRNKSKDFVARLILQPWGGLSVSGSYYRGEFGASYVLRERCGFGVCYDRASVVVRGEWIGGVTGWSDTGHNMKSGGWYAMAGWRVPRSLMFTARVDSFVFDCSRRSDTRQNNYTAGLLWSPAKFLRCQFNYTYEDYAPFCDVSGRSVATLLFTGIF